MIHRLTIIGIGLIGGSLARALRRAGYVKEVIGFGRNLANLKLAVDLGVIDRAEVSVAAAAKDADMIVVAVPVGAMTEVFSQLAGGITHETVITDVGSVKQSVVTVAREALGNDEFARFVPGHPIAGTEQSGVGASREDLFSGHEVLLTPEMDTDRGAVEQVRDMWEAVGAAVRNVDARNHDVILAACSHLPHILAYALIDMLVRRDDHRQVFELAAGGFRDFTRIAGSDPAMWRDICVANREPLIALLQDFREDLGEVIDAVREGDTDWLLETFERARHARNTYVRAAPKDSPDSAE